MNEKEQILKEEFIHSVYSYYPELDLKDEFETPLFKEGGWIKATEDRLTLKGFFVINKYGQMYTRPSILNGVETNREWKVCSIIRGEIVHVINKPEDGDVVIFLYRDIVDKDTCKLISKVGYFQDSTFYHKSESFSPIFVSHFAVLNEQQLFENYPPIY